MYTPRLRPPAALAEVGLKSASLTSHAFLPSFALCVSVCQGAHGFPSWAPTAERKYPLSTPPPPPLCVVGCSVVLPLRLARTTAAGRRVAHFFGTHTHRPGPPRYVHVRRRSRACMERRPAPPTSPHLASAEPFIPPDLHPW